MRLPGPGQRFFTLKSAVKPSAQPLQKQPGGSAVASLRTIWGNLEGRGLVLGAPASAVVPSGRTRRGSAACCRTAGTFSGEGDSSLARMDGELVALLHRPPPGAPAGLSS